MGIVLILLLISVPKLMQTCQVFRLAWGGVQRLARRSQKTQKGRGKRSSLEQHEMKKLLYGLTHLHGIVITR